jgi:hypothetical protein
MNGHQNAKLYFRMTISSIVLGCALYMILSGNSAAQNWAYGIVGAILAHWFKGS